jgi:nucleoside-diphosphate-sugar epimerase
MTDDRNVPPAPYLFCFGLGYSAIALARLLMPLGFRVGGTTTDAEKLAELRASGIEAQMFDTNRPLADAGATLRDATHILVSIPPCGEDDPAFDLHSDDIAAAPRLRWLGYLSTTGVYGNRNGDWIDETATPAPTNRRGDNRLRAEEHWHALYLMTGVPLHVFRLAGIYGPGRSALDSVRMGTARRIDKPGHVFNRIHVDDIAQTLAASMQQPRAGAIYNLADDEPAPSSDVISHACRLLDLPEPALIDHEKADLAPMVRSFYKDNKRIRNDLMKQELGISLRYPDYRAGLAACLLAEEDDCPLGRLMVTRCGSG